MPRAASRAAPRSHMRVRGYGFEMGSMRSCLRLPNNDSGTIQGLSRDFPGTETKAEETSTASNSRCLVLPVYQRYARDERNITLEQVAARRYTMDYRVTPSEMREVARSMSPWHDSTLCAM